MPRKLRTKKQRRAAEREAAKRWCSERMPFGFWREEEAVRTLAKVAPPPGRSLTYRERDAAVLRLGFATYAAYLKSALWASIRARVLDGRRCCACRGRPGQVHHRRYTAENLSGESLEGLVPICRNCHRAIETTTEGKKLPQDAVEARLVAFRGR